MNAGCRPLPLLWMLRLAAKGLFALDLSTETGHAGVGDVLGLSIDLIPPSLPSATHEFFPSMSF